MRYPFGDWTEREIDAAADLFGVEPEEMYELGQQSMRKTEVRSDGIRKNPSQQKPLIGGVNERFWAPIANAFVPINPMADASKTAATTQDLRAVQKSLAKVAVEVRNTLSKMTPEEWEQRERSRIESMSSWQSQRASSRILKRQSSDHTPPESRTSWKARHIGEMSES